MKQRTILLVGFILLKFLLQYLFVHSTYELHRDEFLHLDQGRHLAWGYISVPPFTSWIAYLIRLLGNGVFWVHFFPALFGALTLLLVWKMIEALNGNLFALVLGAFSIIFSSLIRINLLFQPNSSDIFFWTLVYYTILLYIRSGKSNRLFATGIAVGFGILSKYNMVFLLAGMLPALVLSEHRKLFKEKNFYIAIVIACLIVSPNLLWQYENKFPTYHHLKELADTQLVHVKQMDFVKEQVLFFISEIFVIISAFAGLLLYKPFKKYRVFIWSYGFSIACFIFLKAKGYYAIGLYPALIAFGAVYLSTLFNNGWGKYLKPVSLITITALSVPIFLIAMPFRSPQQIQDHIGQYRGLGMLRWEDGKEHHLPQDFADMIGWKEMAQKTEAAYNALPANEYTLVLCDNYGQAGAINYYAINKRINPVSYNADYINWIDTDTPIVNVILVKEAEDEDSSRLKERPLFQQVFLAGNIQNKAARERGTNIFVLKKATADINALIAQDIADH